MNFEDMLNEMGLGDMAALKEQKKIKWLRENGYRPLADALVMINDRKAKEAAKENHNAE